MARRLSGGIFRLAWMGRAYVAMPLLALHLLAPLGTQAQDIQALENEDEIFSLEGPRVKLMLQQASAAEAGRGQKRNLQHASALYCEAAFYGSLEAQYRLARIILDGRDINRARSSGSLDSLQTAATLFRNAAGNGHEGAQSMILITGEQTERLPECLSTLKAAASQQKMQRLPLLPPLLHLKLSYELSVPPLAEVRAAARRS